MESRTWWARHGEAVREAIELGAMAPIETAREECTDALLLCAIARGLVQRWAGACPEPRRAPEIPLAVLVPAPRAARCAGLSSRRPAGSGRRSARVCGALGSRGAVVAPAHGLSVRGTSDDTRLSGDVVRPRLVQREQQADLSQPEQRLPQEPRVAVNVRARLTPGGPTGQRGSRG